MVHATTTLASPVGALKLVATEAGLVAVLWENDRAGRVRLPALAEAPDHPVLRAAARELGEYFAGARRTFTIPLDPAGTAFQKAVWAALRAIPFGETRFYGEIARQLGRPSASRAVGAANGRNPLSIVVPCHRVVGAAGALTGFAGGLAAKAFLLRHEGGCALLPTLDVSGAPGHHPRLHDTGPPCTAPSPPPRSPPG